MTTIESRLAAAERQLRFHQLVIAGLLIALVALVGYGATEGVPDVIRAKRIEVVNDLGTPVVTLHGQPGLGSGQLELYTAEGRRTVAITALLAGGNVCTFIFERDRPRAQHACLSGSQITLTSRDTNDPQHRLRKAVTLEIRDGAGQLDLFNAAEQPIVSAGTMELPRKGGGVLTVHGAGAGRLATLGANAVSGWLDLRGRFSTTDAEQAYLAADGLSVRATEAGRAVNRLNLVAQGQRGVIEANGALMTR